LRRAYGPASSRAGRSLELIEQSLDRLNSLISSARELDKTDSDVIYSQRRRLNFSVLLETLLSSYQVGLKTRGKRLKVMIEPGILVVANEDLLEPIVENLLENAASYAPAGTEIEITLSRHDGAIELQIADRGPGVEPRYLNRIFERYYSDRTKADVSAVQTPEEHFGLGLWIVKRNVEGLGGEVFVQNRPDGGLAATVRLWEPMRVA
jgi:two-component system sensor histidine kinase ChvG